MFKYDMEQMIQSDSLIAIPLSKSQCGAKPTYLHVFPPVFCSLC